MNKLIGEAVMDMPSRRRGIIKSVNGNIMTVDFHGVIEKYPYPAALAGQLAMKNKDLQSDMQEVSRTDDFKTFKTKYLNALKEEIEYLRTTGGKRYRIFDGELISKGERTYVYSFDTDTELHFPDSTSIKIRTTEFPVIAYVKSCENFTIFIQTYDDLGQKVPVAEFTAEPWQLLESLVDRLDDLDVTTNTIAYQLACEGKHQIDPLIRIQMGQEVASKKAFDNPVSFIWGPPGTGKTQTLARIAVDAIKRGMRVLILSYSNVSVDGALLRVAGMTDYTPGDIVRYGYPRKEELLQSEDLTSYAYVLSQNKSLKNKFDSLSRAKRGLSKKSPKRIKIDQEIKAIRKKLIDAEHELIKHAHFVATTVSKAIVDPDIYTQKFDMVIFDEASMAYIPQIVFAASIAKENFCCLGDFRQLPAIVQNQSDELLIMDIFEHVGITKAVEEGYGHRWLTLLNVQHRMHEKIAAFISDEMYEGLLKSDDVVISTHAITETEPFPGLPMSLVDLSGTYSVATLTGDRSHINLLSAMLCVRLAELYADQFPVGIISPYSAQSRLILAMIRDLRERSSKYNNVSSATVHQFQGSEQDIIIYDAVDCYRIQSPGILLTSQKNDAANRLFNVALTRARGKFILVANKDYMFRKKVSDKLLFTKMLSETEKQNTVISYDTLLNATGTPEGGKSDMFFGDRDEYDSLNRYISDLANAKTEIRIDLPGPVNDDAEGLEMLKAALDIAMEKGVKVNIRHEGKFKLHKDLQQYTEVHPYVSTPLTIIDQEIIWFGEPLSAANFISNSKEIKTLYFPCLRFSGKYTARMLTAAL